MCADARKTAAGCKIFGEMRWTGDIHGGEDAVEDHSDDGQHHAARLLQADVVAQEHPATQQHQDGLGVAQHLPHNSRETSQATVPVAVSTASPGTDAQRGCPAML